MQLLTKVVIAGPVVIGKIDLSKFEKKAVVATKVAKTSTLSVLMGAKKVEVEPTLPLRPTDKTCKIFFGGRLRVAQKDPKMGWVCTC